MAVEIAGMTPYLANRIERFLADGKTGSITLNVREGRLLTWNFQNVERLGDPGQEDELTNEQVAM